MIVILSFILSEQDAYSQETSIFDLLILERTGDLNNDSFADLILVKQDTLSEFKPFLLEIFFGTRSGEKKLILQTEKAIIPEFPDGKSTLLNGEGFLDILIQSKKLIISYELLRGHKEYFYKFEKNKFKLIEYNFVESDGRGKIYYENIDFNELLRRTKVFSYQEDKIITSNEFKLILDQPQYLEDLNMVPERHN